MTLVVARRNEGEVYMVGDTKFTPLFPDGRGGQHHFIGGLKIVILHPGAVIAFANNTQSAQQAIVGIHSCGVDLFNTVAVLDYLLSHHLSSLHRGENAVVDFIAAFTLDNGVSELFLIKQGEVKSVEAGYIGNPTAYNRFLHYEHQFTTTLTPSLPLGIAMESLDAVIRDTDLECQTVDGFTVGLRYSADEGFCYVHGVVVEGRPVPIHSRHMSPVTFGGAPEGANQWTIGSSPGDRFGVLTAFCHTGTFGVIYRPALEFEPRIVRGCTAMELVNASMLEVNQIKALLDRL